MLDLVVQESWPGFVRQAEICRLHVSLQSRMQLNADSVRPICNEFAVVERHRPDSSVSRRTNTRENFTV
jgi:hypothetical protein